MPLSSRTARLVLGIIAILLLAVVRAAWEQLVHNFLGSLSIKLGSSRGSVPTAEADHLRETVVDTLDMLNHVSWLSVLVF